MERSLAEQSNSQIAVLFATSRLNITVTLFNGLGVFSLNTKDVDRRHLTERLRYDFIILVGGTLSIIRFTGRHASWLH